MKVLCVVPSYWPAFKYGGPTVSVHGLNKALMKKGINVTVYTTNVGLDDKVFVNQEVEVDGVKVTYFEFVKLLEFIGRTGWQFSWQMTKAIKRNLKTFDLVYLPAVWNYPTAATAYYCRQYKKPYIIAPRGTLSPYTIAKNAWKKRPYYFLIAKRDIKGAALIHYTTEDEAEKTHSFLNLKNKMVVVPNGIDISEFDKLPERERLKKRYPFLKNKRVILFLGRIHWIKGLDILVKAYSKLASEKKDIHLLIAGPDEKGYEKKVRKWLKQEGIMEQTTLTGMLKGEEKLEAFAGSDLSIFPSYSESFGMAAIEAMACGVPVIISDQVGIYKEVLEADAGMAVTCDSVSLAQAIEKLLDNLALRRQMGENGHQLVQERFTLDKVADQMIEAYEKIAFSASL